MACDLMLFPTHQLTPYLPPRRWQLLASLVLIRLRLQSKGANLR